MGRWQGPANLMGDTALDPKHNQTTTYIIAWGVSAVGSARHWQCRGQGFESPTLQIKKEPYKQVQYGSLSYYSKPQS